MSPRRSSRARVTNPIPSAPATNSSTSSISSSRAERSTRSHHKVTSPHRSDPHSQSLDDPEDASKPPPRRTRSGHDEIKEPKESAPLDDEMDEDEEEEVTRCVCGQVDYPGLPFPVGDAKKVQAKENGSPASSDAPADDSAGIFIQCDICKVWQHGGCVGILDDGAAPDEYFCEECRKDLHEVATTSTGQRYSRYLPLHETMSKNTSPAPHAKNGASAKSRENKPRASAEALAMKRRPTMNSYDEEEQVRRAIEESKKDGLQGESVIIRRPKRSRSESEDHKSPIKRQRTGSKSSSPDNEKSNAVLSSSDEALASIRPMDTTPKKIRGAAARNNREREIRETKEKERSDAASRRKARSERRRGEDSDPSEEPAQRPPSLLSSPPPDLLPRSHKKGAKPSNKNRRQGRNQYTKDQLPPSSLHNSLDPNEDVPMMRTRSRSRSNVRDVESPPNGVNGNGYSGNGSGSGGTAPGSGAGGLAPPQLINMEARPSRPKHLNPNRTSMNEMKKRVAGILEFVNRAQEEVVTKGAITADRQSDGTAGDGAVNSLCAGDEREQQNTTVASFTATTTTPTVNVNGSPNGHGVVVEDFTSLTSREMLRMLKSELVGWEDEFGRWSRA